MVTELAVSIAAFFAILWVVVVVHYALPGVDAEGKL
jgi:hypothetical protein